MVDASRVEGTYLHWQESLDSSQRAIEMLKGGESPASEVPARFWATGALMTMGKLAEAKETALEALAPAEQLRHHCWICVAYWPNGACIDAEMFT